MTVSLTASRQLNNQGELLLRSVKVRLIRVNEKLKPV